MENQQIAASDHVLPTHKDLFLNDEVALKHNKLMTLLNQPVHRDWLKSRNDIPGKGTYWYLPIDKVHFLLNRIFGMFHNYEIIRYSTELNSFVAHVKLNYCVPGTNLWLFKHGIGAVPVQVAKNSSAADLGAIKSDAGQKGIPSAVSFAVSNAAQQLGKLFGADLNKSDAMPYMGLNEIHNQQQPEEVLPKRPVLVKETAPQQAPPVYQPPAQPDYNRPQYGAQPQAPAYNPGPFMSPEQNAAAGQAAKEAYYATPQYQTPAYQAPQEANVPQAPQGNNFSNNYNDL